MTYLQRRWTGSLLVGMLFLSALLPRLCAIDRYVTPDELNWIHRSVQFREALIHGRWADTLVAGHPGVTTTWAGALGISLQLAVRPADRATYEWITHVAWLSPDLIPAFPRLASFLTAGRLVVALATSLGVVGIYLLARSLFGRRAALLTGFLMAFDPFTAGLSGLLHVDGLVATLSTLSLLALSAAQWGRSSGKGRGTLVAAGVLAALAVLTKSPAALLIPLTGLILLLGMFGGDGVAWRRRVTNFLGNAGIWATAWLITAALALPALWVVPDQVMGTMVGAASRHAGDALRPTFFLGAVELDHGPLFYPVILLFRLGPLILAGLIVGVVLSLRKRDRRWARPLLMLLLWTVLFITLITPAAKKFDRYALPAIVPLIVVSAVAWTELASVDRRLRLALPASLAACQALLLMLVLPYPLTGFSMFLGGASAAEKVMTVDWGEGTGAAARWLAGQPNAAAATASAPNPLTLAPFFPGRTVPFDAEQIAQADYLVLDVNSLQLDPDGSRELAAGAELLKVVRFGSVDHAWIYRRTEPAPPMQPIPTLQRTYLFGDRVQLLGAQGRATSDWAELTVRWGLLRTGGRYTVQVTLRDSWGHSWGTLEGPLLNTVNFYPEHWEMGETPEVPYRLRLPVGIPPAEYTWELSLYDSENGARLPLIDSQGGFHGVMYRYEGVLIPFPAEHTSPGDAPVPASVDASWLDGSLTLLGHALPPERLVAGDGADIELYWQTTGLLPDGLSLKVTLGDVVETLIPLSRTPSEQWRPGDLIREKYTLTTPPELPATSYTLRVVPTDGDGTVLCGPTVTLGTVEVSSSDRVFEFPAVIEYPLEYRFEDGIGLRGLTVETASAAPGRTVRLMLVWQADEQPTGLYTAFVHLIGPDGSKVAQDDRWPGFLPSNTWASGQVVVDEYAITLPEDAPTGQYRIATGLYDASTGLRLNMTDAEGAAVPDNRLILPALISVSDDHE